MAMSGNYPRAFWSSELGQRIVTSTALVLFGVLTYTYLPIALSVAFALLCLVVLIDEWPRLSYNSSLHKKLTPLYPVLPFILLIFINQSSNRIWLVLLFGVVMAFDTGSYIIGKLFGIHKIAPHISPGKTWEGFIGGCILSLVFFIVLANKLALPLSHFTQIIVSLCLSISAFFGDLWASYLKRRVGLKDTGALLPGHGGILDRFDGIAFATYVIAIIILIQKIL